MDEIPEAWSRVVNALLTATVAWQTPAEVATALGGDVEETTDLLCLMDLAGWLDVWDAGPEVRVTLSARAAARLGVALVEFGAGEIPRWAGADTPLPFRPKARDVCADERDATLDFVPDPGIEPHLAAERSERSAQAHREGGPGARALRIEALPWPTLLVGEGLTPWPGPTDPRTVCPACGSLRLEPHMYCLCCDRWGMDGLVASKAPAACKPAHAPRTGLPAEASARLQQSQTDHERARRKARRRARLQARIEDEPAGKDHPADGRDGSGPQ